MRASPADTSIVAHGMLEANEMIKRWTSARTIGAMAIILAINESEATEKMAHRQSASNRKAMVEAMIMPAKIPAIENMPK